MCAETLVVQALSQLGWIAATSVEPNVGAWVYRAPRVRVDGLSHRAIVGLIPFAPSGD
jgi:hypothetical protein